MAFLLFVFIAVLFPATGNGAAAAISLGAHDLDKWMVSSVAFASRVPLDLSLLLMGLV